MARGRPAKRDIGIPRLHGWPFAAAQAPNKLSKASFRPNPAGCRSGLAGTEGWAIEESTGARHAKTTKLPSKFQSCMFELIACFCTATKNCQERNPSGSNPPAGTVRFLADQAWTTRLTVEPW
jgi:hypothetical protein